MSTNWTPQSKSTTNYTPQATVTSNFGLKAFMVYNQLGRTYNATEQTIPKNLYNGIKATDFSIVGVNNTNWTT